MCSRDRDGNGTRICGSGMGAGLSFTGAGQLFAGTGGSGTE